jgi:phage terminase large subunit
MSNPYSQATNIRPVRLRGSRNLEFLIENFDYSKSKEQIKQGFVLEGGSGSGKTYDIVNFLILYCQHYKNKGKDILVVRDTLVDLKKTVYKDFKKILESYDLYDNYHDILSSPIHYNLFGNTIYFSGLDVMGAHGERHDLIWCNEAMATRASGGIPRDAFKQLNQRTSEAFILDYNPSATDHWIYDEVIPRADTKFCKTTQVDNPFLPRGQREEILRYEPTLYNIQHGTADDYLWNCYGLGLRSAPEGLIFQHVTWIKEFPTVGIEHIHYGSDIGQTHSPSTLVKVGVTKHNLYLEMLCHAPTPSPNDYIPMLKAVLPSDAVVWADSAEPGYISDARKSGLRVYGVHKFVGSIRYGIALLKKYKIHIVDCPEFRKEQSNYKYRMVNGQRLDEPIDGFNHLWDAARYAALSNLRGYNNV